MRRNTFKNIKRQDFSIKFSAYFGLQGAKKKFILQDCSPELRQSNFNGDPNVKRNGSVLSP